MFCIVQCTMYTAPCSVHCALYIVQYTVYNGTVKIEKSWPDTERVALSYVLDKIKRKYRVLSLKYENLRKSHFMKCFLKLKTILFSDLYTATHGISLH